MISSVAAALFWYSMRMECCFASSRERTMILAGLPALPSRKRRTSVLPSEPVPPVIRIVFPSKLDGLELFPFFVGSVIVGKFGYKFRPGRTYEAGCLSEFVSFHASIAEEV